MSSSTNNPIEKKYEPSHSHEENEILRSHIKQLQNRIEELENQREIASSANDFLAVLSHEIRTPLNVIIGLSDLLLNDHPKKDQVQNLKSLAFSAENMMNLVNNILDFNKIKSGRISRKTDTFNIKETVEELEKSYSLHADKNNNTLSMRVDDKLPEIVEGDRLKLIQVLSNLLNNALKFTQNGRVTLELKKLSENEDKIDIYFDVRDTGPGISKKNIEMIFERFARTDDSITQRVGGTGLGLFMVDRLLRLMGSKIEVSSEIGEGSDFHFTLSLGKPVQKARQAGKKIEETSVSKSQKVLLAEDMEEHRAVLRQYFQQYDNIEFTIVSDGEAALEEIKKKEYEIIFLDIKMPIMNGHEVVRHVRSKIKNTSGQYPSSHSRRMYSLLKKTTSSLLT
ncbi:MAG: ATP-binding protein [Cyclobacteriaceae bacterium]